MKVLIVGSDSIHVSSYIQALNAVETIPALLTETPCAFAEIKENKVISFRSKNPLNLLKRVSELKKYLKEMQPEVVHIHQINRLGYVVSRACAQLNIPCMATAWGSDVLVIPKQNRFFKYLVQQTLKRSRYITADSSEMIRAMEEIHPEGKSKYVLLQYGIELIEPVDKEPIIYSNRLHNPNYQIDRIIEYFKELEFEFPDWNLVIAGSGSETDVLKQLVTRLKLEPRVQFVGWLSPRENRSLYAKSSVYVTLPKSDGTAVSLLEAMSAGCVPVVPNLPVSAEWIANKITGIIETPGENPLREALKLNREESAAVNRKLVEEKASRRHCTARFYQLYEKTHAQ